MQYNPPTAPWRPKVGDTVSMETPVLPRDGDEREANDWAWRLRETKLDQKPRA